MSLVQKILHMASHRCHIQALRELSSQPGLRRDEDTPA
ncbi:MAG: hypothetical protein RJA36_443 [Pseudomonadota bacterium]|jgi:hypothetical protein